MSREEGDGFLDRWSRLKRAQAKPAPEPEPEPVEDPPPDPAEPEPSPLEPETLSDEELAALPRIEDLTEGSDVRPFLRAGVPRPLRNAALRRMWMLTPAIRDHNDPAVDYAWDWNTPGGVPGDGVAPSPERAAEMLRDLLAPRPEREPETTEATEAQTVEEDAAVLAEETDPAETSMPAETETSARRETDGQAAEPEPAPEAMPRRRHGSALPG